MHRFEIASFKEVRSKDSTHPTATAIDSVMNARFDWSRGLNASSESVDECGPTWDVSGPRGE